MKLFTGGVWSDELSGLTAWGKIPLKHFFSPQNDMYFCLFCLDQRGPLSANDVYFALYVKAVPTARAPNKLINWTNYWLH